MRSPIVAGLFYELEAEELKKQIKDCFLSSFGPGSLPGKRKSFVKAIIAPHAGYAYSGPCAAFAYKEIGESEPADCYIILGTDHSGYGTATTSEDWETPLGVVKADTDLIRLSKENIPDNITAHSREHSIEVQLPFLRFVNKDAKIVPINISQDIDVNEFGSLLKKIIIESGKRVCIIASSDFTHYGFNYGYFPFRSEVKKKLYELDSRAIEFIKKLDANGFLDYVNRTGATICGFQGIAVLLNTIDAKSVKLLKYYTSGDIVGDYSSAVGYAAISFE